MNHMENPATFAYHIQMENNTFLNLFLQDESKVQIVANECNGILQWLGVPTKFVVNLWFIDRPRTIDGTEWPSRKSVNGGWTIPGENEIFVYREEEWERVVIHETIHALHWDWEMPTKPLACWGFNDQDTLYPHLFEAWTELYAEWLYCGYYNVSWVAQRKWQDYQALQILRRKQNNANWSEDTNIFAYYVLKACLAPHIEFLWLFRNGQDENERRNVLCGLVKPRLLELESLAKGVQAEPLSMRMSYVAAKK